MSKSILKLKKGSLGSSATKIGAGVATNYAMVWADKTIPILAKNRFVTPLAFYLLSLGIQVTSRPESVQANISDGVNIISGVDLVNALVDMGRQAALPPTTTTEGTATVGRTKNPTVPHFNPARG